MTERRADRNNRQTELDGEKTALILYPAAFPPLLFTGPEDTAPGRPTAEYSPLTDFFPPGNGFPGGLSRISRYRNPLPGICLAGDFCIIQLENHYLGALLSRGGSFLSMPGLGAFLSPWPKRPSRGGLFLSMPGLGPFLSPWPKLPSCGGSFFSIPGLGGLLSPAPTWLSRGGCPTCPAAGGTGLSCFMAGAPSGAADTSAGSMAKEKSSAKALTARREKFFFIVISLLIRTSAKKCQKTPVFPSGG